MANLFQVHYWFNIRPLAFSSGALKIVLAVLFMTLIGAIILSILRRKKSDRLIAKVQKRLASWLYTFAILGLFFVFLRQIETPYLAMRFLFLIWLLVALVWFGFIIKYWIVKVPKIKEEKTKQAEIKKYLPK